MPEAPTREALLGVIAAHPRPREGGYGPEVRAAAAAYTRSCLEAGQTWKDLAAGLPISATTLRHWTEAAERRGGLVPVEPVPEVPEPSTAARDLTLISPSGYRLVGLDLTAALALLRGLG